MTLTEDPEEDERPERNDEQAKDGEKKTTVPV
jgi:hypothetical protein